MSDRLAELLDSQGLSKRELGRRVHAVLLDGGVEDLPSDAAIGAKLSWSTPTTASNRTWWLNRPEFVEVLCDLLEVEPYEIGLADPPPSAPGVYVFDDFPQVRPFDAAREPLPSLWDDVAPRVRQLSFSEVLRSPQLPKPPVWVHIPPGGGRQLVALVWEARATAKVVRADTLTAGADDLPADDTRVVVVVERDDNSDAAALARLKERDIIVLAPYTMPQGSHATTQSFTNSEKRQGRWLEHSWRPPAEWRQEFTAWVAGRVEDTLLDERQFLDWLAQVDPGVQELQMPGDILPLLRLAHERGPLGKVNLAEAGTQVAVTMSQRTEGLGAESGSWLSKHGATSMRAIVTEVFWLPDMPWGDGLLPDQWADALPEDCVATLAPEANLRQLLDEADTDDVAVRRHALKQAEEELSRPSRPRAVELLQQVGLLRPCGLGRLRPHPRWISAWWVREHFSALLPNVPASRWGELVLDARRRKIVDDVLAQLRREEVIDLIEKVLDEPSTSVGAVAAAETLFIVVGQLCLDGWKPNRRQTEALHRLWDRVREHLIRRYDGPEQARSPLTRRGPSEGNDEGLRWLAACWGWSSGLERPEATNETDPWFFPGWCKPKLSEAKKGLTNIWWPRCTCRDVGASRHRPAWAFSALLEVVPAVLDRIDLDELPKRVPGVLAGDIIAQAPARGWAVDEVLVDQVGTCTVRRRLDGLLTEMENNQRGEVVDELLLALATVRSSDPARDKYVLNLGEQSASNQGIERFLTQASLDKAAWKILNWPRGLRLAAAEWLSHQAPGALEDLHRKLSDLGRDDAELVAIVANAAPGDFIPVQALWRVAPDEALTRAVERLHAELDEPGSDHHTKTWFGNAPQSYIGQLIEVLERVESKKLPSWIEGYLMRRLLQVQGTLARRVFALLQAVRA